MTEQNLTIFMTTSYRRFHSSRTMSCQSGTIASVTMTKSRLFVALTALLTFSTLIPPATAQSGATSTHPIVLHAARLLDIERGQILTPGEVLVQGERIIEAGTGVRHPAGAETIDLGDSTLLRGLIDAHVNPFLNPGAVDSLTSLQSCAQLP